MNGDIGQLQRIGLKLFAADGVVVEARELVPVFHRWIQTRALDGLLVDVADYAHLNDGPQVVLVAHEGNLALDNTAGRLGLQYYRKQPSAGPLTARLRAMSRMLVRAATLLEEEPALGGRLRFRGDELEFIANDRLLAPNTEEAFDSMRSGLEELLRQIYPGARYSIARAADPEERLTLTVRAAAPVPLAALAERLTER